MGLLCVSVLSVVEFFRPKTQKHAQQMVGVNIHCWRVGKASHF